MAKKHSIPAEKLAQMRIHGKLLYAERLCVNGQTDKAKAYCEKNNLPFPPLSEGVAGAVQKANEAPHQDSPQETSSGESHAGAGDPHRGLPDVLSEQSASCSPIETASPEPIAEVGNTPEHGELDSPAEEPIPFTTPEAYRTCIVRGFCANPKFVNVFFADSGEWASVWKDRNYKLGEKLTVGLERGTVGVNAIYEEIKKPV